MIKVITGEEAGYSTLTLPAIVVQHQIDRRAMRDLLPHLINALGPDEVRTELDKHVTAVEKGEFEVRTTRAVGMSMVGVFQYRNLAEEAAIEAALCTGLDTYILKRVAVVRRQPVPTETKYETVVFPIK